MIKIFPKYAIAIGGTHQENVIELTNTLSKGIEDIILGNISSKKGPEPVADPIQEILNQYAHTSNGIPIKLPQIDNFSSWFKFSANPNIGPNSYAFATADVTLLPNSFGEYAITVIPNCSAGTNVLRQAGTTEPLCKAWRVQSHGVPVKTPEWLQPKGVCLDCPKMENKLCKKTTYKAIFVSGYCPAIEGFPSETGKALGLPIKTGLKDDYCFVTLFGILEAKGVWGYNLFYKTSLKKDKLIQCNIICPTKAQGTSYAISESKTNGATVITPSPLVSDSGQRIYAAICIPLKARLSGQSLKTKAPVDTDELPF